MQEALLVLSAAAIDVLVTDVLLPDGDGIDLVNHMAGRHPRVRPIVVTGGGRYVGPEYFRRIGEALGATVLKKPFDRAAFIAAVELPCGSVSPPA
jgi:DNA-binding NtrC family response regulator